MADKIFDMVRQAQIRNIKIKLAQNISENGEITISELCHLIVDLYNEVEDLKMTLRNIGEKNE